jgi:hypothetical protein
VGGKGTPRSRISLTSGALFSDEIAVAWPEHSLADHARGHFDARDVQATAG